MSLSAASGQQVTVEYATSSGTAESGTDFTAASGTLTFAANATSKTVSVPTTDDAADEDDETFTLTLSSPTNATLDDATATGTIEDDNEPRLTASFGNMPVEHTGEEFTFGLTFSEAPAVSYQTLRDDAFEVTGGAVRKARRRQQGSNVGWEVTVEPDSDAAVTIRLAETTDCDASGAICTSDGRPLSHSLSKTVSGPAASASPAAADPEAAVQALVEDVTPEAAALLGEDPLSSAQLEALDRLGNRNGSYDLGDVLSWADRCRRGEAGCGQTGSAPPPSREPLSGAALLLLGALGRRARLRLALVYAVTLLAWACGDGGGPLEPAMQVAAPDPGFLKVELTSETAVRATGALLAVEGAGIEGLRSASGFELFQSEGSSRREIIVAGDLSSGPIVEFWVPDRTADAQYRVRLLQVTGEDYRQEDVSAFTLAISR